MKSLILSINRLGDTSLQKPFDALALFALRLICGSIMLYQHGWPKFMKLFDEGSLEFPDPLHLGVHWSFGLTVFAEVFCSVFLIIGFATRLAAFPLFVTMVVAFFVVHQDDPLKTKELALLYMVVFFVLMLRGGGAISVDSTLSGSGSSAPKKA